MTWYNSMVPRACFFIDTTFKSTLEGFELFGYSSETSKQRQLAEEDLERIWKKDNDHFSVLPCLSVRSGLDLFLSVKSYPPGSEIIVTAINIPTIVQIIHHHRLKIRSCDIDLDTMAPYLDHLKTLINEKTVAVLVAHLYGKRCDINPTIEICKKYSLTVLEDCAETFSGFNFTGHPESDLVFFSFGIIKLATAMGGAIVCVKDKSLYDEIKELYDTYRPQTSFQYARKMAKYSFLSLGFNVPFIFKHVTGLFRLFGVDHKDVFVPFLRGFPTNLIDGIRRRPSVMLLNNLSFRFLSFKEEDYQAVIDKGDYMRERLPSEVRHIGDKAFSSGYWLFPVIVEHPHLLVVELNQLGVDATRGTSQLGVVDDDVSKECDNVTSTPCAKFLMDQIVYLPVHKRVSYSELDRVLLALKYAVAKLGCKRLEFPQNV